MDLTMTLIEYEKCSKTTVVLECYFVMLLSKTCINYYIKLSGDKIN